MARARKLTTRAKVLPRTKPPFTIRDLKSAIPPHCFKRSVLKSFSYLVHDLSILCSFYYVASNYFDLLPHPLSYVVWPLYWLCQSVVFAAIWVIAHECGHHAFSDYVWLDNTVGMILHTALYVPYFSWRISHRKHHSNSASMEYDKVIVPKRKDELPAFLKYMEINLFCRTIKILILIIFSWHWYLLFNFFGRKYDRFASHFDPYSPIFKDKERPLVWFSNAGILAFTYVLYTLVTAKGFSWLLYHYVVPFVMLKTWLDMVTFLHHTHPGLPHYDSSEWNWLRGALSTVDRHYGRFLNKFTHNINNTHVVHHLFPTIPHYHAMEATYAIQPILGEYYNFDTTPVLIALWREMRECIYVEPDEGTESKGVYWFHRKL